MNFWTFGFICLIVFVMIGVYIGHNRKPNKEARELYEKTQREAADHKQREEEQGREKNRQAVFRQDAVGALERILSGRLAEEFNASYGPHGRDMDRFKRSYPEVYKFLKLFNHHEFRTEDVCSLKLKVGRQQKVIDAQAQQIGILLQNQKDIFKALQMGQPLEFSEQPKE